MFANTPAPPYYAVIFTSTRTPGDQGYGTMAERMVELAAQQPGYLGLKACAVPMALASPCRTGKARLPSAWRQQSEHVAAQELGIARWYDHYELRVAKVERAYGKGPGRRAG